MAVLKDPGDHPERGAKRHGVHHDGLERQHQGAERDKQQDQHHGHHEEAHQRQVCADRVNEVNGTR